MMRIDPEPNDYRKAVLENGLTIVSESHPHVRSVCVGVWVRVGSSIEGAHQSGISHCIEHMVFKGTQSRSPIQISTALESVGGELNAFTERDFTCYHATVLHDFVETAIDVLSDLTIRPTFPARELTREKKVLLQEIAMVEESAEEWIGDLFFSSVFRGEPLGRSIIGSAKTLKRMSRTDIESFFKEHYRPENMVVSVSGRFDFDQFVALCEKFFQFPESQASLPLGGRKSHFQARNRSVKSDLEQQHVMVGFDSIGIDHPLRFEALLTSFFLGGGMSSRLFQEIREKAALAYTVDCDCLTFSQGGVFSIYVATNARSLRSCLEIIGRELEQLRSHSMTEQQLQGVKGQLRGAILLSNDQMEVRQESLARNELVFRRHVPISQVLTEIDRVTPESIGKYAKLVFSSEKEAIVTLGKKVSLESVSVFG